jgi:ElaB/YqjD/DUF883 family membrane-anchored ribosome-binding protein
MPLHITGFKSSESNVDFGTIARKAAQYAGRTSGYVQAHSFGEMVDDASRLVRRFPEHALVAAAAAGLLLGVALRRR